MSQPYDAIIEKKYHVDKLKICKGLQKINGDNIKQLLMIFENSLNKKQPLVEIRLESIL